MLDKTFNRIASYFVNKRHTEIDSLILNRREEDKRFEQLLDKLEDRERLLQETNSQLQGLLDSQIDLLVYINVNNKIFYANPSYLKTFNIDEEKLKNGFDFTQLVHPEDLECSRKYWDSLCRPPFRTRHEQRALTAHGYRWFEWEAWALFDKYGKRTGMAGSGRDITERKEYEELLHKNRMLERSANSILLKIAERQELDEILKDICMHCEKHDRDIVASILLYNPEKDELIHGAGPSVPNSYNELLGKGFPVALTSGTCGKAAALKAPVFTSNIQTDINWTPFPVFIDETKKAGFNSCWSMPILSPDGLLLGTVANYHQESREPFAENIQTLDFAATLASIAIENDKRDKQYMQAQGRIAEQLVNTQKELHNCIKSEKKENAMYKEIIDQLIIHEGERLHAYRCTAGKITIGIGRNIDRNGGKGITKEESKILLVNDIAECESDMQNIFGNDWSMFSEKRKIALIDLRFNLGGAGFRSFKRMIAAIKRRDWNAAADEALNSRWATQVQKSRVDTIISQLRG